MSGEPSKSAIIVSEARSGTNAFLAAVKSMWSDTIALREIFKRPGANHNLIEDFLGLDEDAYATLRRENPAALWNALCDYAAQEEKPLIAKVFHGHVHNEDPVWEAFKERSQIILLIRRNPFKQYVSLKLAEVSDQWLLGPGKKDLQKNTTLVIDPEALQTFVKRKKRNTKWVKEFYAEHDPFMVSYEDFDGADESYWDSIHLFGNTPKTGRLRINLRKQTTRPMEAIVTNYDEVRDFDTEMDF